MGEERGLSILDLWHTRRNGTVRPWLYAQKLFKHWVSLLLARMFVPVPKRRLCSGECELNLAIPCVLLWTALSITQLGCLCTSESLLLVVRARCSMALLPAWRSLLDYRVFEMVNMKHVLMLERFDGINQAFMDSASKVDGTMEAWIKALGSDRVCQSSVAIESIKTELGRRKTLGSLEEDWGRHYLGCLWHIASIKPCTGVCECQSTGRVCRCSGLSSSPKSALLVSTITSLSSDGDSTPPKAGKNCVGEDPDQYLHLMLVLYLYICARMSCLWHLSQHWFKQTAKRWRGAWCLRCNSLI